MKFFHLSDLHIGKQLHHYNMVDEQRDILDQIVELTKREQPDAVLIAGDIYDTPVPSAESVALFDHFLTELNEIEPQVTVCMISGNHDSAKRLDFASSILAKHRVVIAGMPPVNEEEYLEQVVFQDAYGEVAVYLLPFVKPSYVRGFGAEIGTYEDAVHFLIEREQIDPEKRNVIVSHQFYTSEGVAPELSDSEIHLVGGLEQVDVSALDAFDYAALGHIHRKQKVGSEKNRYCGTPLQYSVSEAESLKAVLLVELGEKGKDPVITEIPLVPKRQVRKLTGTFEEVCAAATEENCHDYVSITLTDEVEAYRPKERLEEIYDHILEIRIDNERTRRILDWKEEEMESLHPYDAFCSFFREMNGRDLTEEEDTRIREIINGETEVAE